VICGRRFEQLEKTAKECRDLGAEAVAVQADVSKEEDVKKVAITAREKFGSFNVWVNNAGVYLIGAIDQVPNDVARKVIETNLLSALYGSREAIMEFKRNEKGILINIASMDGKIAAPFAYAYVASKFGVVGLSESIREDLYLEKEKDIHVCTVMPASIDTPLFSHAGNYSGRKLKAMRPVFGSDHVAQTIVDLSEDPKPETFVGYIGDVMNVQHKLARGMAEKIMAQFVDREHFEKESASPTPGNIFEPVDDSDQTSGGWKDGNKHKNADW
jgi:short-subunit dehydrogenase